MKLVAVALCERCRLKLCQRPTRRQMPGWRLLVPAPLESARPEASELKTRLTLPVTVAVTVSVRWQLFVHGR